MKHRLISSLCSVLFLFSCGGEDSEVADAGNNPDQVDAGQADAGALACAPVPSRLIVLGDSITACTGVGGKEAATCGPKILHSNLAAGDAPSITYENLAVPGAVTTDVVDQQLATVTGGAGHALVLIYVGGNDMQRFLTMSDSDAQAGFPAALVRIEQDWQSIFSFFDDTVAFPDGTTILMNDQYNPFDDCTAPPFNLSAIKSELLGQHNDQLASLATSQSNAAITNQHEPYLGHGHHYDVQACPHYNAGAEPFMADIIHPNAAGHAHLATQWDLVTDRLYDCQ